MRDLLVLLAAAGAVVAAGVYLQRRQAGQGSAPLSLKDFISGSPDTIINGALPGQPGWGWQYFSDGTAISPDGTYYYQGKEVWRP